MRYSIPKIRRGYKPLFRLRDPKLPERAGPVGIPHQFIDKGYEMFFFAVIEREDFCPVPFPAGRRAARIIDILKVYDLMP